MPSSRLTEVRRSSSMMPILIVSRRQPQALSSTRRTNVARERDLLRPVHLGLYDIDRTGAAVAQFSVAAQIVQRDKVEVTKRVDQTLRRFLAHPHGQRVTWS